MTEPKFPPMMTTLSQNSGEPYPFPENVKCFHVQAGQPCTRYLEGVEGERKAIGEWIIAIPEHVIDDWGMNAASEIHVAIVNGVAAKGAHYWEKLASEQMGESASWSVPTGSADPR